MQLAILIEEMRREGYEMSVSAPRVLYKRDPKSNQMLEPIEEVTVDVDSEYSGSVIDKLSIRGGDMGEYKEIQVRVYFQRTLSRYSRIKFVSRLKFQVEGSWDTAARYLSF